MVKLKNTKINYTKIVHIVCVCVDSLMGVCVCVCRFFNGFSQYTR
jgi:hypothetical protein